MIDWGLVIVHAGWVAGLSIMVTGFGLRGWLRDGGRLLVYGGLSAASVSIAALPGTRPWERLVWVALAVAAALTAGSRPFARRRKTS